MVLKTLLVSVSQVYFYKYLQEKREGKEEGRGGTPGDVYNTKGLERGRTGGGVYHWETMEEKFSHVVPLKLKITRMNRARQQKIIIYKIMRVVSKRYTLESVV